MNKSQSVNDHKSATIKKQQTKIKFQAEEIKNLSNKLHRYKGIDTRKNNGCDYSRSNAVNFFGGLMVGIVSVLFIVSV